MIDKRIFNMMIADLERIEKIDMKSKITKEDKNILDAIYTEVEDKEEIPGFLYLKRKVESVLSKIKTH